MAAYGLLPPEPEAMLHTTLESMNVQIDLTKDLRTVEE